MNVVYLQPIFHNTQDFRKNTKLRVIIYEQRTCKKGKKREKNHIKYVYGHVNMEMHTWNSMYVFPYICKSPDMTL